MSEGREVMLVLRDNGGVWEQHNEWLRGRAMTVMATRQPLEINLRPSRGHGQWTCRPTSLAVARRHGFNEPYLSSDLGIAIPVRIEDEGGEA